MELKSKGQSLKNILFKYLLSIALGLVISVGLILAFISAFYHFKWIFPANYTENLILEKRADIATSKNFEKSRILFKIHGFTRHSKRILLIYFYQKTKKF